MANDDMPMPRPWQLVALVVVTAAGGWLVYWAWATAHYPIRNAPAAGKTIIAFGDSLIVGVGATAGRDMVSRVSQAIGRPIVNAGVAGDTTAAALQRMDETLARKPDVVIVLVGGNDAINRVPLDQTVANLRHIITTFHNQGATVLLLGIRGGIVGDPYRRAFATLARELRAAYVPNVLDSIWGNSYLMADEVHPNDRGHGVMAERITPVLQELLRP